MSNKIFAERLNKALDDIGAPERSDERIEVLSKLIKVPKFKAEALLNGTMLLDEHLFEILTQELEVTKDWLMGMKLS